MKSIKIPGKAILVLGALICLHNSAAAQVRLPIFKPCKSASAPKLPARWHAVALMSPFTDSQLDIGEFIYDGALPAMRATIYGLGAGVADILITDKDTFLITGRHDAPEQCISLGQKFNPPSAQWLAKEASCSGTAPIGSKWLEWWKSPGPYSMANWLLFRTESGLPWRSLFVAPSRDPAIIGGYAMSYFPEFSSLSETKLSRLRDFCASHLKTADLKLLPPTPTARELMNIRNPAGESEREQRIAALVPGLSLKACSSMTPPVWPDKYVMTAIITPNLFEAPGPLPSVIYYDWREAATQEAIMFLPQTIPPVPKLLAYLKKGVGYDVKQHEGKPLECRPSYPGIVRPDWMKAANCKCKGVLDHNPDLNPRDVTQILACPIKHQEPRVLWSWYTTEGHPVVFAEAGARGNGLMQADYHQWFPGMSVPASEFELPKACTNSVNTDDTRSCSDCHTVR
ncbi:MAG TPA: hypothetical protein VHD34_05460 [Xanthobacteraceae bacterium]|nr:hypothetical protein [Xanthobacteraceae bacterium]